MTCMTPNTPVVTKYTVNQDPWAVELDRDQGRVSKEIIHHSLNTVRSNVGGLLYALLTVQFSNIPCAVGVRSLREDQPVTKDTISQSMAQAVYYVPAQVLDRNIRNAPRIQVMEAVNGIVWVQCRVAVCSGVVNELEG